MKSGKCFQATSRNSLYGSTSKQCIYCNLLKALWYPLRLYEGVRFQKWVIVTKARGGFHWSITFLKIDGRKLSQFMVRNTKIIVTQTENKNNKKDRCWSICMQTILGLSVVPILAQLRQLTTQNSMRILRNCKQVNFISPEQWRIKNTKDSTSFFISCSEKGSMKSAFNSFL